VDRNHQHEGVAAIAVQGALDLIAQAGGGVVEAYPHDTAGKKISASFLYSATLSMHSLTALRPVPPTSTLTSVSSGRC
jgi:hypothetical protein